MGRGGIPCGGTKARGDLCRSEKLEAGALFRAGAQNMNGNGSEAKRYQEWRSMVRMVVGRQENIRNLGAQ